MYTVSITGDRIKQLRERMRLRQSDLAKKLGISGMAISTYESGKRMPSRIVAEKLADVFNVSVDYLLGRTNDPTPPFTEIFVISGGRIGKRIKQLREKSKISIEKLSKEVNVSSELLLKIENKEGSLSEKEIKRLADFFDVSMDYILGNTDEPTLQINLEDRVNLPRGFFNASLKKIQLKPIPVYDGASAGKIGMFPNEYEIVEYTAIPMGLPGEYGVIVHGDSMEPEISEGDIVIVDTEQDVPNGKKAVVSVDGGILVKVLYRQNGIATLVSLNSNYPPVTIKSSEIPSYILGKVVSIIKNEK